MASTSSWRSITVVVDPQQKAHPALQKATALAARTGARLTGLLETAGDRHAGMHRLDRDAVLEPELGQRLG